MTRADRVHEDSREMPCRGKTSGRRPVGRALLVMAFVLSGCGEEGRFSKTGDLGVARHGHVALRLKDGSVLVLGGLTKTRPLPSGERFIPAKGKFIPFHPVFRGLRAGPGALCSPTGGRSTPADG